MRALMMPTVLGLVVILGAGVARAADTPGATRTSVATDEVMGRERQWAAALIKRDRDTLEQLVGDEYALTTAAGTTARARWMQSAFVWETKAATLRDGWSVQLYGDVAIARGVMFWHVLKDAPDPRTGSKEMKSDFSLLDVWVKRAGRWQVVARHSILLPPSPPAPR